MISQLTQLLAGGLEKRKSTVVNSGEDNEDPTYPQGFTPINVQTQPEEYPRRVRVTIRPQKYQAGTSAPMNYPTGLGSNPGDNPTNLVVPNLDDMTEMEKARVELPKQLEDRCKWSAAKWYNQLSCAKIGSWKDLAQAFMKQYSHVTDMTPDKITLQNIEKKQCESFRQYAQRWREMATQVQPPLLEKETTMLFINTLKSPFINHMLGNATKSFSDIVMSGEMIENAVRTGKIYAGENSKRSALRKKEHEVNNTSLYNKWKLYQSLFDAYAVSPFYLKLMQPLFPKWYNANAQCEYHARIMGHSIENCTTFKKLIERFIKMGIVRFDDPLRPNVAGNPLSSHSDQGLNAIIESGGKRTKTDMVKVKTPLKWVWQKMINGGLIMQDSDERPKEVRSYCEFHAEEGHEIQECAEFKALVQSLMDNK
ncbi:hypothetical protein EPI10_010210 [Gossypium australe]|uniref:Retrotransposon gag domain-containing protein n=1 Tax=Gossypium australe TaxID=47621 RepID=A0A5B6UBU9_9ROSI|nr:hypothetical protein EPI10_010210 [Gossypium australe]